MKHVTRAVLFVILVYLASSPVPAFVHSQVAPSLLITEIAYDAAGRDEGAEWMEIANLTGEAISLENVKLGDEEQLGSSEGMVRFPATAVAEAGAVLVIAVDARIFRQQYGASPDYEIVDSDPAIPDMDRYVVWGTGSIALANDGDEVVLAGPDNVIIDAVSYGESAHFLQPPAPATVPGGSLARIPANCDSDTASEWQAISPPTPGVVVTGDSCPAVVNSSASTELLPIGAIQGARAFSPRIGEQVSFRGIVTGIQEDRNARGAIFYSLFVQDLPAEADGDIRTSDALPVFTGPRRPSVNLGDIVQITGRVTEFYGLTEIDNDDLTIEVVDEGTLPEPVVLTPPSGNATSYFESLEGMRVTLPEARVVGPTYGGCGFAAVPEDGSELPIIRESIDDSIDAIIPVLNESDVDCGGFPSLKVGDRISGLSGPLTYHFEQFKIVLQADQRLEIKPAKLPLLPPSPRLRPGEFSIATLNADNYFDAKSDTGLDAEPVPTSDALRVKQRKLAMAIGELLNCPTVLALQEVENAALLAELADLLLEFCEFSYEVTHRESADLRGIDLALLSNPGRVEVTGVSELQTCALLETDLPEQGLACEIGEDPLFSRPPLQVEAAVDGVPFTFIVNHFKSKSGGELETALRRRFQADHLAAVVGALTARGAHHVVALGDFNDYPYSQPLQILTRPQGSLVNVFMSLPRNERYSYNFSGASQLLDTMLMTPVAADLVVSRVIFHINADFPASWSTDPRTPYRVSDHDIPFAIVRTAAFDPTPTSLPTPAASQSMPASPDLQDPPRPPWVSLAAVFLVAAAAVVLILIVRRRA